MAQGRILLQSISESRKLAALKTDSARLLYTWMISHLDINGCFPADPKIIKGKIFTRLDHTEKDIAEYLQDLNKNHLIIIYQTDGDIFLQCPDFVVKQPNLRRDREKPHYPEPVPGQIKFPAEPEKRNIAEVESAPIDKRDPGLQILMDYAMEKGFSLQGSQKKNRRYAYNLLRKKDPQGNQLGIERVKQLIDYAILARGEPYAPQINDFTQLYYKFADLLSFLEKKQKGGRIGNL